MSGHGMSSDPFLTSDEPEQEPGSSNTSFNVANCEADLLSQILDELESESDSSDDKNGADMTEDVLRKLQHILPDTLLLAALDLIDRDCVIKYISTWGRVFYEVRGTSATYTVHPSLDAGVTAFCSCPSFMYAVLMHEEHSVCKHVFAVQLAQKLGQCVARNVNEENVKSLFTFA